MRSDPATHGYEQSLFLLGDDECLHIDHSVRLVEGDQVAIFWGDTLAAVGRLARTPVPHRRYVVDVLDGGKVRRRREFGPHDEEVSIYRVVGRGRVVPI